MSTAVPSPPEGGTTVDEWLRERLARAVVAADSCRTYRGTSNRLGGYVDLADAVTADIAFCGDVHPAILAVDADSQPAAVGIERLADELAAAGHCPVVVASGAPGRAHLFARVGADRDHWAHRARTHGGDVRRRIRPPLSCHRDPRHQPRLVRPDTPEAACRALEAPGLDALPASLRRLLAAPAPATADGTRSATLYAACRRLARRGYTADEAHALIRRADGCAAAKLAERGPAWWRRYVWAPASHCPTGHGDEPDPLVDLVLDEIAATAQTRQWAGRDGRAAVEVLIALLQLARYQQRLTPEAAHRTLALLTGRSREAVRAALARLGDTGWVRRARVGGARWVTTDEGVTDDVRGSVWRLSRPDATDMAHLRSTSAPTSRPLLSHGWYTPSAGPPRRQHRRSDLIAGGVLTIDAVALVDAIAAASAQGGLTTAECRRASADHGGRTSKRALQRARQLGLVEPTSGGRGARWVAAADLTRAEPWQRAAEHAGVLGRAETARAAIARERADYRDHLADTFQTRRETAHRAHSAWRHDHDPRCGATTRANTPCQRPVPSPEHRCAWHQPDPPRCQAPTRNGPACQRPVTTAGHRCTHHAHSPAHQPDLSDHLDRRGDDTDATG